MRFQVQMWYLGEWQYQDSAASLRLAGLLAMAIEKTWANFGARVRVWDADEKRVVVAA